MKKILYWNPLPIVLGIALTLSWAAYLYVSLTDGLPPEGVGGMVSMASFTVLLFVNVLFIWAATSAASGSDGLLPSLPEWMPPSIPYVMAFLETALFFIALSWAVISACKRLHEKGGGRIAVD